MAKRQTEILSYTCDHETTEDILTYGGDAIGARCAVCSQVLGGYGLCDGVCDTALVKGGGKRREKLLTVLARNNERFCSEDCKKETAKVRRKEAEEVAKGAR